MRVFSAGIVLAVLASGIEASAVAYCKEDACLQAAKHPPAKEPGCSTFFKTTLTPKVKTSTVHTTKTVYSTKTITDETKTSTTTVHPVVTVTGTTTVPYTSTTTSTIPTTTTLISPVTTVPSTTTDVSTSTTATSTQTITTTDLLPNPPIGKRNYPATAKCPTTTAGPAKVPTYAGYACHNSAAYSSACSCAGAKHSTTTIAPCTTTVTSTETCTRTTTTHVCYTTTVIAKQPSTTTTTSTVTSTTTETSSTTSTSTETVPTTITSGLTTTSTTTTTQVVTTTTETVGANPLCSSIRDDFQLEITDPVTLKLMYASPIGNGNPDPKLITFATSDLNPAEFSLDATGVWQTNNMNINPAAFAYTDQNDPFGYVMVGNPSASTAFKIQCRFGDPNTNCQFPFICTSNLYDQGAYFAYCDADPNRGITGGLIFNEVVPGGCSVVPVDGIHFVDDIDLNPGTTLT